MTTNKTGENRIPPVSQPALRPVLRSGFAGRKAAPAADGSGSAGFAQAAFSGAAPAASAGSASPAAFSQFTRPASSESARPFFSGPAPDAPPVFFGDPRREGADARKPPREGKAPLGVYFHIPFCERKCAYCDFLSESGASPCKVAVYFRAAEEELRQAGLRFSGKYRVDTVFIGGGTPSFVEPERISEFLEKLRQAFFVEKDAEITIEANPCSFSLKKAEIYRRSGINRLSLGAQSFRQADLTALGRLHRTGDIREAFAAARTAGFDNINLDLMFSLPGQTVKRWENTLREALALEPEHISFYSLQIEENTPFYHRWEKGLLRLPSDEEDRRMYHLARRILREAGLFPYEFSNAARPGRACRHNLKYWSMAPYLGLGPGASSMAEGVRWKNTEDPDRYLSLWAGRPFRTGGGGFLSKSFSGTEQGPGPALNSGFREGAVPETAARSAPALRRLFLRKDLFACEVHRNTEEEDRGEFFFTGLRKTEGIFFSDFEARYRCGRQEALGEKEPFFRKWEEQGFLERDEKGIRLTERGIDISNRIFAELI